MNRSIGLIAVGTIMTLFLVIYGHNLVSYSTLQYNNFSALSAKNLDFVPPRAISDFEKQQDKGIDLKFEKELSPGLNYYRYIVSYVSEGYHIRALLTKPMGQKPLHGWPGIIICHGTIVAPETYSTEDSYAPYFDTFARNNYIVLKPDLRGIGLSEGKAATGFDFTTPTIDTLNALAPFKRFIDIDTHHIGLWGHSMGGLVALNIMTLAPDIRAAVIWDGLVAPISNIINHELTDANTSTIAAFQNLLRVYGTPQTNPQYWNAISAYSQLENIHGPIQLHHGTMDTSVPFNYSLMLRDMLVSKKKAVELYLYKNDDHFLSQNLQVALQRSLSFYDKNLKN